MKSISKIPNVSFDTIFRFNRLQVYTPSDQVLKQVVRKNWRIRSGTIEKSISMLVTPKVQVNQRVINRKQKDFIIEFQEVVREHFACPTLEGAELEDQGNVGTALTHWEKRLFEVRFYSTKKISDS